MATTEKVSNAVPHVGEISADSVLTLAEVQSRMGWGVHAMRAARRAGLKVHYRHRRGFVLGSDVLAYVSDD